MKIFHDILLFFHLNTGLHRTHVLHAVQMHPLCVHHSRFWDLPTLKLLKFYSFGLISHYLLQLEGSLHQLPKQRCIKIYIVLQAIINSELKFTIKQKTNNRLYFFRTYPHKTNQEIWNSIKIENPLPKT
jgi:hypothetical protein